MSSHHNHHRSSHHSRSRLHHSFSSHYQSISNRSRTTSSHLNKSSSSGQASQALILDNRDSASDWSEHKSSSGKVYYYNTKTGISQWEIPNELKQHHRRTTSPESEISESSSIRQQQDNSPTSSASSHVSTHSDSLPDDKPLLTPSLAHYFRPDLIGDLNSSQVEELERQANHFSKEALLLNEKILKESVDLKIAKSLVQYVEISLEAQEEKCAVLREAVNTFGFS